MDSDGLPIIGPGLDFTKITAIHQKRTLAFLNHFITHTAHFLNRFSVVCEDKLSNISLRIQRLETTISLLEAKLSSVPGLEDVTVATSGTTDPSQPTAAGADPTGPVAPSAHVPQLDAGPAASPDDASAPPPPPPPAQDVPKVSQHPVYAKYFKMHSMGVPLQAVKNKMVMEGLDGDLLDTPNAPVPDGAPGMGQDSDDDDEPFSDDDDDSQKDQSESDDFSD